MSMKSLGEYTLLYGCFLCVGYSLDLGRFGWKLALLFSASSLHTLSCFFPLHKRVRECWALLFYILPCPLSSGLRHGVGLAMRSITSAPSNKYEKRPKFFEGKSRWCTTTANASLCKVECGGGVCALFCAHFLLVCRLASPDLLHFCVVVKVFLPNVCLLQLLFFELSSFPPIMSAAVTVEIDREVTVIPGVYGPLLLAHWLST